MTLIGDIVSSKQHPNRRGLQRALKLVLDRANDALEPEQPLEVSVGDEFQGAFRDVASATWASLVIRLALLVGDPGADSRYGLGDGPVTVFDAERRPVSQDGPGWWAARAAIERARGYADTPRMSSARTCLGRWDSQRDRYVGDGEVEAFLLCRDTMVGGMSHRQQRLLFGVLSGRSQEALARDEHITQGAVSQSLRRSGAFVVAEAHFLLLNDGSD